MNKIIRSMLASLGFVTAAASAMPFVETTDAGHTAETAKSVANHTTQINGTLGTFDYVDIFKFSTKGGAFFANTIGSTFDTMLFLFDEKGTKLAFNDDYYGLQSYISVSLSAGNYFLAIDPYSYNYNGTLAGFAGAGGMSFAPINYVINLSEVNGVDLPEPASLMLFGLGVAGMSVLRRRKGN